MDENINNEEIIKENEADGMKKKACAGGAAAKSFSLGREIFEWFYTIAIALIIALIVKGFFFDMVKVDGESMVPTLQDGDRLIVRRIGYTPAQGDIIILDSAKEKRNEYYDELEQTTGKSYSSFGRFFNYFSLDKSLKTKYYVKRIIALPGQTVDLRDGMVYVDGEPIDEPYYKGETYMTDVSVEFPQEVEDGYVFVMGDNRGNSTDSRSSHLGQVPYNAIMGKAIFRLLPFNSFGTL